jgi:transposase
VYQLQVKHSCEDLDLWRQRLTELERDIDDAVERSDLAKLLTTIDGIGPQTSARLIAELDDPSRFDSADALAAYVGVVPGLKQSGKSKGMSAGISPIGNGRLRAKLWMPVLTAVRTNEWLKQHYERWLAAGKKRKVTLTACMRKLLHAVYSVAKSGEPFVPRSVLRNDLVKRGSP